MGKRKETGGQRSRSERPGGQMARAAGETLKSWSVGALPIVNKILQRLKLEEFLRDGLPSEDRRVKVPTASVLLVLLRNLLLSREPLYGIGEWAARHAPDLLGLTTQQVAALNDDRVGRALDRLFDCDTASLSLGLESPRNWHRARRRTRCPKEVFPGRPTKGIREARPRERQPAGRHFALPRQSANTPFR